MEPSPVESAGGLRKYSRILGVLGGDSGDTVGRGGVETNQKRSEPNLCTSERSEPNSNKIPITALTENACDNDLEGIKTNKYRSELNHVEIPAAPCR